jgi:hypothetical protein
MTPTISIFDFRSLIDAIGDRKALAVAIGTTPGHINAMYRRNSIPAGYWLALVNFAAPVIGDDLVTLELLAGIATTTRIASARRAAS